MVTVHIKILIKWIKINKLKLVKTAIKNTKYPTVLFSDVTSNLYGENLAKSLSSKND